MTYLLVEPQGIPLEAFCNRLRTPGFSLLVFPLSPLECDGGTNRTGPHAHVCRGKWATHKSGTRKLRVVVDLPAFATPRDRLPVEVGSRCRDRISGTPS